MAQQALIPDRARRRRRLSLPLRVSFLLVLSAIIPLLFTVAFSEWQARPALTAQANVAMTGDVKERVQLIDTYFKERLLDAQTLGQVPSVQAFLAAPGGNADLALHADYSLSAGTFRDKHYTVWSLFDTEGHPRLSYPGAPVTHGQYRVPPESLQAVHAGKTFISGAYVNPTTKKVAVDIYSPIVQPPANTLLGFIRASLNLDYILDIVAQDKGNNGSGSGAFILDENGVRIADTDPSHVFTAVTPLAPDARSQASQEARYGTSGAVPVLRDTTLARRFRQNFSSPVTFDMTPAGKSEAFQVVQHSTTTMPWNYFVLSPNSTVAAVANQQLLITSIIALAMFVLAAILGLIVGRRITYPIMNSVERLRSNSDALNALAARQKDAASEQMWVVDSSQVGLQSVQYYTDATQTAAHQLSDAGLELARNWHYLDPASAMQRLERIVAASQYIENSAHYQRQSNQKLATALKVATQVTEQLAMGATSATEASQQLERVVEQLRDVVGR